MSLSGGSKATFTSLDGGSNFTVQYNPREFAVDKAVTWEESKTQGQSAGPIQFQKGAPMTASMELLFDTTKDDSGDVKSSWVDALLALTNATVKPQQGEPEELKKLRPSSYEFTWGSFSMKCVVESVNVTYLMFSSSGTPVRARCTVKLKEWVPQEFSGSGSGSTWDSAKLKLVEVSGGQTISQVAAESGADWRQVMADNGLTNPTGDYTGLSIMVRT